MARSSFYNVGNTPPRVTWTVVRGDTAAFKVYVTDDAKQPITIGDWSILMKIKRPNVPNLTEDLVITDNAETILTLNPFADPDDGPGEFTVFLEHDESLILQTGDIFDIELSLPQRSKVWTVAQGSMVILEDVTD
jgi:hypothetical protein